MAGEQPLPKAADARNEARKLEEAVNALAAAEIPVVRVQEAPFYDEDEIVGLILPHVS